MQDNPNDSSPNTTPESQPMPETAPLPDTEPTTLNEPSPGLTPAPAPDIVPIESEQEVTQPVAPVFTPTAEPAIAPAPVAADAPKPSKKRKRLIVAGSIIGAVLLLGGIAAGVYNLWYQNPDKVLTDAAMNAIKASSVRYGGTMNIVSTEKNSSLDEFKVSMTGKNGPNGAEVNVGITFTNQKKRYNLTGDGLFDKEGNLFVKLKNVQPFIDLLSEGNEPLPESVRQFITKVDDSWIKLAKSDVQAFSPNSSNAQSCVASLMKKVESDPALGNEVADVYKQHRFIDVIEKLPSENGSLGYVIEGDKAKAEAFVKDFKETTLYKELRRCDSSFTLNENDLFGNTSNNTARSRVEVWVDRWSHALTKVHVAASNNKVAIDTTLKPVFNEPVVVTSPTKFITLKDLQDDIEAIVAEFMSVSVSETPIEGASPMPGTIQEN